jgi:hypothetical protein
MSRRLSCGNICAIWSICAGFIRGVVGDCSRARAGRLAEVPAHGEEGDDEEDENLGDIDGLFGHGGAVGGGVESGDEVVWKEGPRYSGLALCMRRGGLW